jgi:hypothetical protein
MTSNINYTSINAAFPVAGQDNDSQGFRDNFAVIQTALNTASNEISDIQLNYAKLNDSNYFDGNTIEGAVLKNNGEQLQTQVVSPGTVTLGKFPLNFAAANYQVLTISTNTNFQINSWPAGVYAKLRLEITPTTSSAISITFTSPTSGGVIKSNRNIPYTATNTFSQIWDVWTRDGGQNTFVALHGTYTSVIVSP